MKRRDTDITRFAPPFSPERFGAASGRDFVRAGIPELWNPKRTRPFRRSILQAPTRKRRIKRRIKRRSRCAAVRRRSRIGEVGRPRAPLWRSPASRSGPGVAADGWPGGRCNPVGSAMEQCLIGGWQRAKDPLGSLGPPTCGVARSRGIPGLWGRPWFRGRGERGRETTVSFKRMRGEGRADGGGCRRSGGS